MVHGLWPQYEQGFPEFCQNPAPRLDRNIVSSMLDLMPAPRLIFHEWDEHGVCSGPAGARLFRDHPQGARAGEDPARYLEPKTALTVTPDEVEDAFVKANPGHEPHRHRGHLRRHAAERGAHLPVDAICNSAIAPRSTGAPAGATSCVMPPVRGG